MPTRFRNDALGFLLVDVSRLMRRAFAQRLQGSELTFAQARVLVRLTRSEGLRQIELAALLEVQPITLARLLDQLDALGLVERRADPNDRRAYRLFLTPAAAPHLEAIRKVMTSVRREALREIDAQQVGSVLRTLARMRRNLVSAADDAAGSSRRPSP